MGGPCTEPYYDFHKREEDMYPQAVTLQACTVPHMVLKRTGLGAKSKVLCDAMVQAMHCNVWSAADGLHTYLREVF